jgi:hypothetical protein
MMPWWQLKEESLKPIGGFLILPYVLYREVKEQIDLWKTKGHTPFAGKGGEVKELKALVIGWDATRKKRLSGGRDCARD